MKIDRLSQPAQNRPEILDTVFRLEMTGEELIRLHELSHDYEGGMHHANTENRFWRVIGKALDLGGDEIDIIFRKMIHGKYNES